MDKQVSWLVELSVRPGQLEGFRTLTGEMVEHARNEQGVLGYQRFVSEDGKHVHAYERYADSDVALAHLRSFAEMFSSRFLALVERRRFVVFGRPSNELRKMLDGFGAEFASPFGEFNYWA